MCVCAKNACSLVLCQLLQDDCSDMPSGNGHMLTCAHALEKKGGGAQNVINKAFQIHRRKPTVDYVLFLSPSSW